MAEKINYKEYLSQFGKIETDAKNRIKSYLEEQIKQDAALKELYQPEKIDDCYNFIKEVVRATGSGQSATVEDEIVFKMARDYYLDILPKQAEEPAQVKETGAETATEADSEAETELKETEETTADNENTEDAESENEKPEAVLHQAGDEGEKSEGIENSEAETEQEPESAPADNENEAEKDYCGFEVFGEDEAPEESAETAATAETETETKAEPENEKPEPFIPKYDEEGNGLLFDF